MTGAHFVDTNVFVYSIDSSEPDKQPQAAAWLEWLWRTRRGRLSYQVLAEFYVTVTRKLNPGLDLETSRRYVRDLEVWSPVAVDGEIVERAWALESSSSISFWDALIIAAAERQECRYLLTEDLADGQTIGGVAVVNPFRHAVPAP